MEKLNVKVVVFDWSGTLSDDIVQCYNAGMKLREHFGLSVMTFEQWQKQTMANAIDFFRAHGITEDAEKILRLYSQYFSENPTSPKAFDDAEEILSFLKSKGKFIVIVSGHPHEHMKNEMVGYGFDKFVLSASGSIKNKAEKLKELAAELGVKQSEIVYVGDMVWDIRAAKEAGIRSIAILRGYHSEDILRKENPDLAINSLTELKDIII